jgi:hypothetical protein
VCSQIVQHRHELPDRARWNTALPKLVRDQVGRRQSARALTLLHCGRMAAPGERRGELVDTLQNQLMTAPTLCDRALLKRKAAPLGIMPGNLRIPDAWHKSDSWLELWAMANELEGIVAKDARSIYTAGRSSRWLKIKTGGNSR